MKLTGKVGSGKGDFAQWIAKLENHYERKTGMRLFPGTLNVHLDQEYRLPAKRIRLEGSEYGGNVSVNLVPCTLFGRRAFILRTDANEEARGDHLAPSSRSPPTSSCATSIVWSMAASSPSRWNKEL